MDNGKTGQDEGRKAPISSKQVRMGRRTIFLDVNMASNNRKYLKVTESHFIGEGNDVKRSSFVLFPEDVVNFQSSLNEIVDHLS